MRTQKTRSRLQQWTLVLLAAVAAATAGCSAISGAKEARYLDSGKKYQEKKDYARAILQFRNAIKSSPQDPEPYYQLGLAYLATYDTSAAIAYLLKATELDPKHVGAQLKLAQMMAVNHDAGVVRDAEKRAQAVLALSPGNADALATLALTEIRLGKPASADQHLQQALQGLPQHLKSSMTLAMLRVSQKDWNGAEKALQEAVARAPKSAEALVALGRLYLLMEKPADAERQFRLALALDPKNASALTDLATMQVRAGQKEQAEQTYKRISESGEKQDRFHYARFLFQEGKRDAAIAEFERLAKADPKDRAARTYLVAVYAKVGRLADAEKVLTAALQRNSKDAEALLQRSELYLGSARLVAAQADATESLRQRPDSAEAHYVLAKIYQARGASLTRRQELGEALRLNPKLLAARLDLSQALLADKSAKGALDLMNQTPAEQKQIIPAVVERNWALLAMGDQAELRKGIDQGLAMARAPDLLLQDALLKLSQGSYSGARPELQEVLEQNPADLRALEALARSYVAQKQPATALEKVREHVSRHPQSAPTQQFLGEWLAATGDGKEARTAFTAAKAADPNFTAADLALAELDVSEGKLDSARQRLSAAASRDGGNVTARVTLGMLEEVAGNYAAAMEHYRKALDQDRNNFVALNNLAYLLANDANKPDEALTLAQQAKELAPNDVSVEDTIGWAFYRKGIYRTALAHLEHAASRSQDPAVKYHLAMAYLKAGEPERGRQTLQAALRMNPNLPEAKVAQQVLAEATEKSGRTQQ